MRKRHQGFTKILCAVLCLFMAAMLAACDIVKPFATEPSITTAHEKETTPPPPTWQEPSNDAALHRVAYIPIDNRPVNKERVSHYDARSCFRHCRGHKTAIRVYQVTEVASASTTHLHAAIPTTAESLTQPPLML